MSTKKTKLVLANGAMVMAMAMAMVGGAMAVDITGHASATIINPIAVSETRALTFGSITTLGAAGTVSLTAAEETVKADVTVNSTGGSSGKFTVTGGDSNGYTIAIPTTVSLSTDSTKDGGAMTVTLTKSKPDGVLVAGTDSFYVGGSLAVLAKQNSGTYNGTYNVTVAYQ